MDNSSLVKQKLDIMDVVERYVTLKRSGSNTYKALCPFHNENTPSFMVHTKKQIFSCFGQCQFTGDVIDFVQKIENFQSPMDALQKLSSDFNIVLEGVDKESYRRKKEEVAKRRSVAAEHYKEKDKAKEYLKQRCISSEVADKFGIGYNEKNHSITIPIQNAYSEVVGMAERFFDQEPKYKNSPESEVYKKSEILYGLDKARKNIEKVVYIVEGYFDVLSMYQFGIGKTVAYCGQAITDSQSYLLSKYTTKHTKICLIPDKDSTGQNLIRKNIKMLRNYNKNSIGIINLPDGCKDINDYLMAGRKFEDLPIEPYEMFMLKRDLDNCMTQTDEYEVAFEYSRSTKNTMLRAEMAAYLSKRWGKSIELVNTHMNSDSSEIDYSKRLYSASESWTSYAEQANEGSKNKLFTNIKAIDKMVKGIKPKEVMFLMGRSGSGKTTFILNYIYNLIFKQKKNVLFASLELPKESIIPQMVQIHNKMTSGEVEKIAKSGEYNEGVVEVIETLDQHWKVADQDSQTLHDIEMCVRTANDTIFDDGVQVVFIDYFQYLKSKNKKMDYNERSDMAREIKALAKRLGIVIVALTQANREGGKNGSERLDLTSARDTGAIEESGDYVLGIYRPSSNPKLEEDERLAVQNEMYCQILKNRWGLLGEVKLYFEGMTKRIEDWRD